jgi:hypothetical protein
MLSQLGVEFEGSSADYEHQTHWGVLQPGDTVPGGEGLFPRVELPEGLDA